MSSETDLLNFAKDALTYVSRLTRHIFIDYHLEGALKLSRQLNYIRVAIDNFMRKSIKEESIHEVRGLINDLGSLCNWPNTLRRNENSILEALLRSQSPGPRVEPPDSNVVQNLLDFTRRPPLEQHEQLSSFASFSKLSSLPRSLGITRSQHHLERNLAESLELPGYPLPECPHQVSSMLYDILPKVRGCACKRKHENRLSLRSNISRCNHCAFSFDMLIRSSPPDDTCWQDVQICCKQEPVGNADASTDTSGFPPNEFDVGDESLCGLSKDLRGSALSLEVGATGLRKLCNHVPSKQHVGSESSHPLREILETHCLSTKEKLILSYIIALSFWRYYDSRWMGVSWTSNSIHFFSEGQDPRKTPHDIYANKPYLAVTPDSGPLNEYAEDNKVFYRYPRILELCIILLEIVMGCPLNFDQNKEQVDEINLQWSDARTIAGSNWEGLLDQDCDNFGLVLATFQSALAKCLDIETFVNAKGQHDVDGRKKILLNDLVEPLYRLINALQYFHALEKVDSMRPIHLRPARNDPQAFDEQITHAKGQDAAQTARSKGIDAALSKKWLQEVDQFNTKVHNHFGSLKGKRVRVAILDTGYDINSVFFQVRGRVEFKDFAGNENEAVDLDGHGTHTTSLVMRLAPEADIFVARITRTGDEIRDARNSIRKAIEYAVGEWKVDIISMSFGFAEYDMAIVDTIRRAEMDQKDQLLLFAAASNYGDSQPEMFPARCDSVISIRRTDTRGDFSEKNPPIDPNGASVFGTLGHQVPAAWLSQVDGRQLNGEVTRSGSSVATAIASGIAAMTLTHATLGFQSGYPLTDHVRGLWTRYGMLAMFIRMSDDKQNRQQFLTPHKISYRIGGEARKVLAEIEVACKAR